MTWNKNVGWKHSPRPFLWVFGILFTLLFIIEHINGRFWLNDFRVYYGAGSSILHGEPIYGVAHGLGTGVFKYAPILALFYVPFALLPYGVAASIQYILIALAFLDGIIRADRLVRTHLLNGRSFHVGALFLAGIVCVVHLHRELHLGNINMLLLWLLLVGLDLLLRDREWAGAIILGAAILAKPHFMVLLPLLFLYGRYKVMFFATATLLSGLVLPVFAFGPTGCVTVHREWFAAMAEHNASLIYLSGEDHRAVNTIYTILYRPFLQPFVDATPTLAYAILGLVALAFGALVLFSSLRRSAPQKAFTVHFFVLIALVPNLTLTDTEHFLLALPLVLLLAHSLVGTSKYLTPAASACGSTLVPKAAWTWWPLLLAPVLFAYGGNWEDALGPLSEWMIAHSILGIGNLLVLVASLVYLHRLNHSALSTSN